MKIGVRIRWPLADFYVSVMSRAFGHELTSLPQADVVISDTFDNVEFFLASGKQFVLFGPSRPLIRLVCLGIDPPVRDRVKKFSMDDEDEVLFEEFLKGLVGSSG